MGAAVTECNCEQARALQARLELWERKAIESAARLTIANEELARAKVRISNQDALLVNKRANLDARTEELATARAAHSAIVASYESQLSGLKALHRAELLKLADDIEQDV